jgi:hypothetical protein
VPAVPIPAGAVVSRAPKTWMGGQFARSMSSIGEASTCVNRRRMAAVDNIVKMEEGALGMKRKSEVLM